MKILDCLHQLRRPFFFFIFCGYTKSNGRYVPCLFFFYLFYFYFLGFGLLLRMLKGNNPFVNVNSRFGQLPYSEDIFLFTKMILSSN